MMSNLHTKPQSSSNVRRFETELMLDWNGSTGPVSKAFFKKIYR